jgi:ketosteroid isomerase-like protein
MSHEDDVREASRSFYAALNRMLGGDSGSMADIWSHGDEVTAMHPLGGRVVGWKGVEGSFAKVAGLATGGQVALRDQLIHVLGDVAYEAGTEQGGATLAGEKISLDHRVTNIYHREGGAWKIVHHHTDISPAMVNLASRL